MLSGAATVGTSLALGSLATGRAQQELGVSLAHLLVPVGGGIAGGAASRWSEDRMHHGFSEMDWGGGALRVPREPRTGVCGRDSYTQAQPMIAGRLAISSTAWVHQAPNGSEESGCRVPRQYGSTEELAWVVPGLVVNSLLAPPTV